VPRHLFPLHLGCGTKRRAEDSPGLGILDIRSYKHIHGEAIIPDADLDFAFPDELETVPAAPSAEAAPESNASALALDFASNHAAKRAKRAAAPASSSGPESSLSRTSSTNTTLSMVHSFLFDSDTPEPPPRSPSSMSPEKTPRAAETQNLDAAAEAAAAEAADAAEDTKRGVNTRKNPKMQKTARDGQRHWHDQVQEMRIPYDLALTGMVHPVHVQQILGQLSQCLVLVATCCSTLPRRSDTSDPECHSPLLICDNVTSSFSTMPKAHMSAFSPPDSLALAHSKLLCRDYSATRQILRPWTTPSRLQSRPP